MEDVYTSEGLEEQQQQQQQQQDDDPNKLKVNKEDTKNKETETINNNEEEYPSTELVIDEISIDPINAFEMFQGKIFFQDNNNHNHSHHNNNTIFEETETPIQRLSRLRTEILSLENDIMSTKYINEYSDSLLPHVNELTTILQKVENEIDNGTNTRMKNNDYASKSIINQNNEEHETTTTTTAVLNEDNNQEINYELEKRLKTLEELVGVPKIITNNNNNNNESIIKRLNELEEIMTTYKTYAYNTNTDTNNDNDNTNNNNERINTMIYKTKIIRNDLEAALKAKIKLSSSSSSNINNTSIIDDTNIISSLYNQLQNVSNVSSQLPTIIQRLETLSLLHKESSQFMIQLHNVTKDACELEKVISCIEEGMDCLDVECRNNMEKVDCFMKDLDARLEEKK